MVRLNPGMYTPTYGPTTTGLASTVAVSTTPSVSTNATSGNAPTANDKSVETPGTVMYTVNAPNTADASLKATIGERISALEYARNAIIDTMFNVMIHDLRSLWKDFQELLNTHGLNHKQKGLDFDPQSSIVDSYDWGMGNEALSLDEKLKIQNLIDAYNELSEKFGKLKASLNILDAEIKVLKEQKESAPNNAPSSTINATPTPMGTPELSTSTPLVSSTS